MERALPENLDDAELYLGLGAASLISNEPAPAFVGVANSV